MCTTGYPLVNVNKTMDNHHFESENSRHFHDPWPLSKAISLTAQHRGEHCTAALRKGTKGLGWLCPAELAVDFWLELLVMEPELLDDFHGKIAEEECITRWW